jgi:1,4-dihydroxy-2-naphthoate octaprenyltransferase
LCIYTQVQTYFTKLGGKAGAGAGLLLLLFVSGGVGCDKGEQAPKSQRLPPQVVVRKPVQRDLPLWVRAPVDLKPLLAAEVVSKQLGYLSTVLVERGDVVRRGQLLALVRPSELPDQLAVARGALLQAQAQLQQAKENRSRTGSLAPSGVVSQLELQQSSTALSAAEAAEAGARANLSALATRLGATGTRWQYSIQLGLAYLLLMAIALATPASAWRILPALTLPLAIRLVRLVWSARELPQFNRALGGTAQLELWFGLALAVGVIL